MIDFNWILYYTQTPNFILELNQKDMNLDNPNFMKQDMTHTSRDSVL